MKKLSDYMRKNHITQDKLATLVGVSQPAIQAWLTGRYRPSLNRLEKISKVTGIAVSTLVREFSKP